MAKGANFKGPKEYVIKVVYWIGSVENDMCKLS